MVKSPFSEVIGLLFFITVGVSGVVVSEFLCTELAEHITPGTCEALTIGLVIVLPLLTLIIVFFRQP